jgi:hypothetical protein
VRENPGSYRSITVPTTAPIPENDLEVLCDPRPDHLARRRLLRLGVAVFAVGFAVADKLTPYDLWKELVEKQNRALGMVVGGVAVALGLIIAAAISG